MARLGVGFNVPDFIYFFLSEMRPSAQDSNISELSGWTRITRDQCELYITVILF